MRMLAANTLVLLALQCTSTLALAIEPLGSARLWNGRERVAILGASGTFGATLFGMLQRCAPNNVFSGLSEPRGVVGSPAGASTFNRRLSAKFGLAYAPESLMALADWADPESVSRAMADCGAVICGTRYVRTSAKELSLEVERPDASEDVEGHCDRLDTIIKCASAAGVRHMVVVETVDTPATERNAALQLCRDVFGGDGFTYVVGSAAAIPATKGWTFCSGVPSTPGGIRVNLSGVAMVPEVSQDGGGMVSAEDLAAVVVQSLQTLPWEESRLVAVKSEDAGAEGTAGASALPPPDEDPAKTWVVGAKRMEEIVSGALFS